MDCRGNVSATRKRVNESFLCRVRFGDRWKDTIDGVNSQRDQVKRNGNIAVFCRHGDLKEDQRLLCHGSWAMNTKVVSYLMKRSKYSTSASCIVLFSFRKQYLGLIEV